MVSQSWDKQITRGDDMKEMTVREYLVIIVLLTKEYYWVIMINFIPLLVFEVIVAFLFPIGLILAPAFSAAFTIFLLNIVRQTDVNPSHMWSWKFIGSALKNGLWWKTFIIVIFHYLASVIGFVLLVIPGIYISVVWSIGFLLLVDKNIPPDKALVTSRELIHELGFWKILSVFLVVNIPFAIIAVIPGLSVLSIFLYPFMMITHVVIYETAIGNKLVFPEPSEKYI